MDKEARTLAYQAIDDNVKDTTVGKICKWVFEMEIHGADTINPSNQYFMDKFGWSSGTTKVAISEAKRSGFITTTGCGKKRTFELNVQFLKGKMGEIVARRPLRKTLDLDDLAADLGLLPNGLPNNLPNNLPNCLPNVLPNVLPNKNDGFNRGDSAPNKNSNKKKNNLAGSADASPDCSQLGFHLDFPVNNSAEGGSRGCGETDAALDKTDPFSDPTNGQIVDVKEKKRKETKYLHALANELVNLLGCNVKGANDAVTAGIRKALKNGYTEQDLKEVARIAIVYRKENDFYENPCHVFSQSGITDLLTRGKQAMEKKIQQDKDDRFWLTI